MLSVSSKLKLKSTALNRLISVGAFTVAALHPSLPPGNTSVLLTLLLLGALKRPAAKKGDDVDASIINKKLDDLQRGLNAFGIERMTRK